MNEIINNDIKDNLNELDDDDLLTRIKKAEQDIIKVDNRINSIFQDYLNGFLADVDKLNDRIKNITILADVDKLNKRMDNITKQVQAFTNIDYTRLNKKLIDKKINILNNKIMNLMNNNEDDYILFKNYKLIKKELSKLILFNNDDNSVNNVDKNFDSMFKPHIEKLKEKLFELESHFDKEQFSTNKLEQKLTHRLKVIKNYEELLLNQISVDHEIENIYEPVLTANKQIAFKYNNDTKKLFNDFITNSVFPFIEKNIYLIHDWYKRIPKEKQIPNEKIIEIRKKIMELTGIEEIKIHVGKTTFNRERHREQVKDNNKNYPRDTILKLNEPGYIIVTNNTIIRKAGVTVNYR